MIRAGATLAMLAMSVTAAAADGVPAGGRLEFAAFRNGSEIGRGTYRFAGDPARREVSIAVDIQVKVAFITVYRFTHRATELWEGDRLVRMEATTDDNGTARSVRVARDGEKLAVASDGRTVAAAPDARPLSFWQRGILTAPEVIDPADGTVFNVSVRATPGPGESYEVRNEAGMRRQIAFDADGVLAGFRIWAHDGSELEYRRIGGVR